MEKISNRLNATVIVPSLNPDEKLRGVVDGLLEAGFEDVIVIDDGSAPEYKCNFPEPSDKVTLLVHEVNRGKGAAMKTAYSYILERENNKAGVIAVDGDGQHRVEDVLNCVEAMNEGEPAIVMGCRNFDLPHVPTRSRVGNKITSFVFKILFGMKLSDTQTGLRAIPMEFLPQMLEIAGDRYEYETNMLMALKPAGIPIKEVKIETVYINENETSHFRTIRDSARIYGLIIKYVICSISSTVVDWGICLGLGAIIKFMFDDPQITTSIPFAKEISVAVVVSIVVARIVSTIVNFLLNKNVVFKGKGNIFKLMLKYYALAIPMLAISALGTAVIGGFMEMTFVPFLPDTMSEALKNALAFTLEFIAKLPIDLILYIISFRIQREWVFKGEKPKK